jgi:hypothetical protein
MPSSPPNFYADELETALKEQSFGIGDFTITATEPIQCSASVTLLEGRTIVITLRNAGYSVSPSLPLLSDLYLYKQPL